MYDGRMQRGLDMVRDAPRLWGVGFAVLLGLTASAAAFGAVAYLILLAIQSVFGWSDARFLDVLLVSALAWAPLAVGAAAPGLLRMLRSQSQAGGHSSRTE